MRTILLYIFEGANEGIDERLEELREENVNIQDFS
jgi:hypothetical protein